MIQRFSEFSEQSFNYYFTGNGGKIPYNQGGWGNNAYVTVQGASVQGDKKQIQIGILANLSSPISTALSVSQTLEFLTSYATGNKNLKLTFNSEFLPTNPVVTQAFVQDLNVFNFGLIALFTIESLANTMLMNLYNENQSGLILQYML